MGKKLVPWIGIALATAVTVLPSVSQEPEGRKFALLIGVNDYSATELNDLQFTENDMTDLAKVLGDAGFKCALMTKASKARYQPTARNIREELQGFLGGKRREDTLVVAFAGHGLEPKDSGGPYFCPMDADLLDKNTLVSFKEVYKALEDCRAGVRVLLVDACRNEPLSKAKRALPEVDLVSVTRPQGLQLPNGVAALFSCSKGQYAIEDEGLRHGVFFHFVLQGLKGAAANKKGAVTLTGLQSYLEDHVHDYVWIKYKKRQMPESRNTGEGPVTLLTLARGTVNSIGIRLVFIPPGKFMMGSPKGKDRLEDEYQHEVEITQEFYMGAHEVTQEQYRKVMNANPSKFSPGESGNAKVPGVNTDDFPVDSVSWGDAMEFCRKLTFLERDNGWIYDLPTEAEWEYACRAGTQTAFHFGDLLSARRANFDFKVNRTSRVGAYEPNDWGSYDMHGNVCEWCKDWYDKDYYKISPRQDPKGPAGKTTRVLRGGSWGSYLKDCRSAGRGSHAPDVRYEDNGFRIVARLPPRTP